MKKVKVAILGCGGFAGFHAVRFKNNPDAQVVGLCDVKEDIVKGFMERHLKDYSPKPAVFTDTGEMYRAAKPDGVVIATPHTLHFQHAVQALDAGCHVLMEKPMVTDSRDAHRLAKKVKEAGKILVIGYNTACSPEFAFVRETIRKKTLGNLELIVGYISQNWLRGTAGKWRQDPALSGGGQAYDSGAHLLNSLCWSVESDIAEVFAFVDNHGTKVDINSSIAVKFTNGVMASIAIGGNCPSDGTHMVFMFDEGRIEVDGWSGNWLNVFGKSGKIRYPIVPGKPQASSDNFIDAILGRAEPCTNVRNGIIQSELMDAIYESARTGNPARPKRA